MRSLAIAAVASVLTVCVMWLIGPATTANSASSYYDRQIVGELKDIQRELDAIKYNTGAVCEDASAGFLCKKF